jgi:predicted acylesterase/phospholipase RssA
MVPTHFNPYGRIALSLSGGGFRAAAFNIGMMSFLNTIKFPSDDKKQSLLDHVVFTASASGGSFTAAFYGMYKLQGRPFEECYRDFINLLKGDSILQKALNTLNDDSQWGVPGKGKTRNLINAFAKVYDTEMFKGQTFGIFDDQHPPIDFSVCFNSTEFYRGLSFRFQIDSTPGSREFLGSRAVYFRKTGNDAYQKLKLGDILAASSCFPAGFEPIVWPKDFTYDHSLTGKSLSGEELKNAIVLSDYDMSTSYLEQEMGLMDGGINDNQALYSTMMANDRKNGGYDLIIVSDVASYFMDPYEEPSAKPEDGIRGKTLSDYYNVFKGSLKKVSSILSTGLVLSLVLLLGAVASILWGQGNLKAAGYIALGFSIACFTMFLVAIIWKRKKLKTAFDEDDLKDYISHYLERLKIGRNFSKPIIDSLLSYLSRTKLGVLENMLKTRLYSVLIMVMDVNLKHVRRLIYEMFFEDGRYNNRRVYNVIYELSSFNYSNRDFRIRKRLSWDPTEDEKDILLIGTGKLQEVAESARLMGTTLWFDQSNESKFRDIIVCGQFTICSNLLEYTMSLENAEGLSEGDQKIIADIKDQLLVSWEGFKNDVFRYY